MCPSQLARMRRIARIADDPDAAHLRGSNFQEFEFLPGRILLDVRKARHITARSGDAECEARTHGIGGECRHDRDCRGRSFGGKRSRTRSGDNYFWGKLHQLTRKLAEALIVTFCPARLEHKIIVSISETTHRFPERSPYIQRPRTAGKKGNSMPMIRFARPIRQKKPTPTKAISVLRLVLGPRLIREPHRLGSAITASDPPVGWGGCLRERIVIVQLRQKGLSPLMVTRCMIRR